MKYTKEQKRTVAFNLPVGLGALAICIVTAVISIMPQTYDIRQGEISPETITAPADFIDEAGTRRLMEEAQANVGPVYTVNADLTRQSEEKLAEDFAALGRARDYAQDVYQGREEAKRQEVQAQIDEAARLQAEAARAEADAAAGVSADPQASDEAASEPPSPTATPVTSAAPTPSAVPTPYVIPEFSSHAVDWAAALSAEDKAAIAGMLPDYLDEADIGTVAAVTRDELAAMQAETEKLLQQMLHAGVGDDDMEAAKQDVIAEISRRLRLSAGQEDILSGLVENGLYANLVFDEEATQAKREEAAAAVEPVTFKKGENIVLKGNRVTPEQYEVLRERGLLSGEKSPVQPYFAVTIYIVVLFAMYIVFLAVFNKRLLADRKKVAILSILTALAYVTTALAQLVAVHIFPIVLFVILGAVLLSPKNALVYSVFLSLLLLSVTSGGREFLSRESLILLLMTLPGCFFAICALKDMRYRSRLILAGLAAAVPAAAAEYITYLFRIVNVQQTWTGMAMSAASGLLCGIASIGVLPIVESLFHLTTPTRLLELSDPNHPLTKRLMVEAPGTYHHSMLVANLAEAGCNAVGGFSLLARVGAYFHDAGKLANPLFFKENQHNFNPHDNMTPKESSAAVKRHVPDGVEMLKKCGMPKEIITIAAEHHGNSLTGYFYAQAVNGGGEVKIKDYRYSGVPPTTREGAIIMLADVVEAAVRSLDAPSREQITETVNRLIRERYDDGQLDNAPLNRSDLNKIAEAFINLFAGVYHSRIKYPDIKIHGAGDEDNVI